MKILSLLGFGFGSYFSHLKAKRHPYFLGGPKARVPMVIVGIQRYLDEELCHCWCCHVQLSSSCSTAGLLEQLPAVSEDFVY